MDKTLQKVTKDPKRQERGKKKTTRNVHERVKRKYAKR